MHVNRRTDTTLSFTLWLWLPPLVSRTTSSTNIPAQPQPAHAGKRIHGLPSLRRLQSAAGGRTPAMHVLAG
jgi:hypothetical protein